MNNNNPPSDTKIGFPEETEYTEASSKYIRLVDPNIPIIELLKKSAQETVQLYRSLNEEQLAFRYAPEKWNLKEVLVHLIDDERIYAYRALRFARNDKHILPAFDQEAYTHYAESNERELPNILEEYQAVRQATILLFQGFPKSALLRKGKTTEWTCTVRAILYHIAGHELNHLKIIKEKYLSSK
jgi:Protein of unknown function (DUF664).